MKPTFVKFYKFPGCDTPRQAALREFRLNCLRWNLKQLKDAIRHFPKFAEAFKGPQ